MQRYRTIREATTSPQELIQSVVGLNDLNTMDLFQQPTAEIIRRRIFVLNRFLTAARTVVIRCRAAKRLTMLKRFLLENNAELVEEVGLNSGIQKKSKVLTQSALGLQDICFPPEAVSSYKMETFPDEVQLETSEKEPIAVAMPPIPPSTPSLAQLYVVQEHLTELSLDFLPTEDMIMHVFERTTPKLNEAENIFGKLKAILSMEEKEINISPTDGECNDTKSDSGGIQGDTDT